MRTASTKPVIAFLSRVLVFGGRGGGDTVHVLAWTWLGPNSIITCMASDLSLGAHLLSTPIQTVRDIPVLPVAGALSLSPFFCHTALLSCVHRHRVGINKKREPWLSRAAPEPEVTAAAQQAPGFRGCYCRRSSSRRPSRSWTSVSRGWRCARSSTGKTWTAFSLPWRWRTLGSSRCGWAS